MIDCETLSTELNAQVLTIGAVKFNPNGDDILDTIYLKIDIESCSDLNLDISESTIEWWSKQKPDALEDALSETGRLDVKDAMKLLYKFCSAGTGFWSHGAIFDIVVLEQIFKKLKIGVPWKYYQVRDTRTLFSLGIDPTMPTTTAHNAIDDAIAQVRSVQTVTAMLRLFGLEPFK
jgi:hypothetical protein